MVYATVTIVIEVDENKLTKSQQRICGLADSKPFEYDHVAQIGIDNIASRITPESLEDCFYYLRDGKDAITISVRE